MATLEELKRKVDAVEQLESVVRTMKALAALNIRQYEEAVRSLADYSRTIELGLHVVLRDTQAPARRAPSADGPAGMIVIGSDQGMCGQFNEQIARRALRTARGWERPRLTLALGARAGAALEAAGEELENTLTLPGSVAGITGKVHFLLTWIERWQRAAGVRRVVLFYNRYEQASSRPYEQQLLPLDPRWLNELRGRAWASRRLPIYTMPRARLLARLVQEYLFVWLYRALASSLATENASRLRAMQAAQKNVEEKLDDLTSRFHRQRQNSITSELLDVVSGSEAVTQESR